MIFCAIYLTSKENRIRRRRKKKQIDFIFAKYRELVVGFVVIKKIRIIKYIR